MSLHILLIEDQVGIADFITRGLSEEGYSVTHVANGPAGWIELQRQSWDLILLDWWLPGEEGLSLLQRFRAHNRTTPVLFLTARDSVPDRVEGLNAGADDYLCKPFAFEELLARVRAILRRQDQSADLKLEYRDIVADAATQRATRGGHLLDLTAKEFSLLLFFLRKPGIVFSRSRIYESVWGDHFDGISNTIEVHVKELRRKLEQFGPRLIQTRRGRGYVLDTEE